MYYLEARGLFSQDLEASIGSQEKVSAILNRQEPLTLDIIRRLNQDLGVPAEVITDTPLTKLRMLNSSRIRDR